MLNKILILSASSGAGHVRAAAAIETAMKARGSAQEIIHVDALQHTSHLSRHVYSRAYLEMVNSAPGVLGLLYDHFDRPGRGDRQRLALDTVNAWPLIRLIRGTNPDYIVCTHFMPAQITAWMQGRGLISCRQSVVVTDFDLHAMWLCKNADHYFVALDETREYLQRLGATRDAVTVSGIPIDPAFSGRIDRREVSRELGLDPERTTVLVTTGGFGVGPVSGLVSALLELKHRTQILVMCGRNVELKAQIDRLVRWMPDSDLHTVRAVGYTSAMPQYMAASDLIVGKPGGLTTSEALSRGLIFVIVNPIPGQEERNADHLLEQGAAIRCNNLPVLAYKIDRLLDQPERMSTMRSAARALATPLAAQEIAAKVEGLSATSLVKPLPTPRRRARRLIANR